MHRKLNDRTGSIGRTHIEAIVNSVPSKDRIKALNVLKHITSLSDINGIQKFLFSLNKYNKYTGVNTPGKTIFVGNNGGIGSALAYLNNKILPSSYEKTFKIFSDIKFSNIKENSSILIDKKTDLSLLGKNIHIIKKLNLKLVYLDGLENYILPIDQTSPDNLVRIFSELYNPQKKQLLEDKVILDLKKRLKKLGLIDNLKILYYDDGKILEKPILFSDKEIDSSLDIGDIVERMSRRIPKYKIEELFDTTDIQNIIKEYLASLLPFSHFASLQKMALEAKKINRLIKKEMKKYNIKENEVYYYSPYEVKSFQVASWIYSKVNNIPQSQFYDQDIRTLPKNSKMVIVLDDFSGTGDSLIGEVEKIEEHGKHEFKVIAAALYATDFAKKMFVDYNQTLLISKKIKRIEYSQIPEKSEFLSEDNGFLDTNSALSMEYMSPDNNNNAFNKLLSPLFTLIESSIKY